jgi:hypothetical protein
MWIQYYGYTNVEFGILQSLLQTTYCLDGPGFRSTKRQVRLWDPHSRVPGSLPAVKRPTCKGNQGSTLPVSLRGMKTGQLYFDQMTYSQLLNKDTFPWRWSLKSKMINVCKCIHLYGCEHRSSIRKGRGTKLTIAWPTSKHKGNQERRRHVTVHHEGKAEEWCQNTNMAKNA